MYSRAPRFECRRSDVPSPLCYDPTVHKEVINYSDTPFLSSARRFVGKTSTTPGPDAYFFKDVGTRRIKGGSSVRYTAPRFKENDEYKYCEETPADSPDGLSALMSDGSEERLVSKLSDKPEYKHLFCKHRHDGLSVPPKYCFGFENVCGEWRLIFREKTEICGVGIDDVGCEIFQSCMQPGCTFSTAPRFTDKTVDTPGPGCYYLQDIPKSRKVHSLWSRDSRSGPETDRREVSPGPGYYETPPSPFDARKECKRVHVRLKSRKTKKVSLQSNKDFPAPNAYCIPRFPLEKCTCNSAVPFSSGATRMPDVRSCGPGPCSYEVQSSGKPSCRQRRTTLVKKRDAVNKGVSDTPGPCSYDVHETKKIVGPSYVFSSKTKRFKAIAMTSGCPQLYNIEIARKVCHRRDPGVVYSVAPFLSSARRFRESLGAGTGPQRPASPAPNKYDLSHYRPYKNYFTGKLYKMAYPCDKAKQESKTGMQGKQSWPGPAHYDITSSYRKRSFNATLPETKELPPVSRFALKKQQKRSCRVVPLPEPDDPLRECSLAFKQTSRSCERTGHSLSKREKFMLNNTVCTEYSSDGFKSHRRYRHKPKCSSIEGDEPKPEQADGSCKEDEDGLGISKFKWALFPIREIKQKQISLKKKQERQPVTFFNSYH